MASFRKKQKKHSKYTTLRLAAHTHISREKMCIPKTAITNDSLDQITVSISGFGKLHHISYIPQQYNNDIHSLTT